MRLVRDCQHPLKGTAARASVSASEYVSSSLKVFAMALSIPDPDVAEPPFAGSRMKIQRARRFLEELGAELERYNANEPYTVKIVTNDMGAPSAEIAWKGVGLLPGAILGDAIHSLRTALDQMASELARRNGRSDKGVYFPFSESPETFEAAVTSRKFAKAGEDAVHLLKQFQPYRGGNDDLRAIHDLDIIDKHSTLIPAAQSRVVKISGNYKISDPLAGNHTVAGNTIYLFPPSTSLEGREILPTLKNLVELVEGVLEAFAALISAREQSTDLVRD